MYRNYSRLKDSNTNSQQKSNDKSEQKQNDDKNYPNKQHDEKRFDSSSWQDEQLQYKYFSNKILQKQIITQQAEMAKIGTDQKDQELTNNTQSFYLNQQESKNQKNTYIFRERNQTNLTKFLFGLNENNNQLIQHLKYFEECRELELFFFNKMNFTSNYQAQNIWGQWITRCMAENKINYLLIPNPKIASLDKQSTVDHMVKKGCNQIQGEQIYDEFLEKITKIYQKYENLKNWQDFSEEIYKKLGENIFIEDQIEVIKDDLQSCFQYSIQLSFPSHYVQILRQSIINQIDPNLQKMIIFETCFNYDYLQSLSLQWEMPQAIHLLLQDQLNCQTQLFSSPFKQALQYYYSQFYLDRYFGSKGSFYQLEDIDLSEGFYECHQSYTEQTLSKSAVILLNQLEKFQTDQKQLGFLFLLPWEDCQAYIMITQSEKFFIKQIQLDQYQHSYIDTYLQQKIQSKFSTIILVFGTKKFKEQWELKSKLIEDQIRIYFQ